MKLEDKSRRDFLQRMARWGLACATGSYLTASLVKGQNPPPPPPEPPDTTWTATIVPSGEPGDPLVVAGRVFAPGKRTSPTSFRRPAPTSAGRVRGRAR